MIKKDELIELRKTCTIPEIVKILDSSESTVMRYLKKYGLTKKSNRTDITDDEILNMWNKGYTVIEIKNYFKCAHDTITKRLDKYDIDYDKDTSIKKHFARIHDEMWNDIKSELDAGKSMSYIAKSYKMRTENVKRLMMKNGYVYNKQKVGEYQK